jgi:flagellar biosynthesis/type III secretory pathway protein FliH
VLTNKIFIFVSSYENEFKDIHNSGYRKGREEQEAQCLQNGFDAGMEEGMRAGFMMGRIYAACRLKVLDAEEPLKTVLSKKIKSLEDLLMRGISREMAATNLPLVSKLAMEFGVDAELCAAQDDMLDSPSDVGPSPDRG